MTLLSIVVPASAEDAVVVSRQTVLQYREKFMRRRAKRAEKAAKAECEKPLMGQLLEFKTKLVLPATPEQEASLSLGPDLPMLHVPSTERTFVLDPSDRSTPPGMILKALRQLRHESMSQNILQVKKLGLLKFHDRMMQLHIEKKQFSAQEIHLYSQILFHSVNRIFFENPEGENPIADVVAHFQIEDLNFHSTIYYAFLSSLLAGINFKEASQFQPYFKLLITSWKDCHAGSRHLKSSYDKVIEEKIRRFENTPKAS
jgi:hypothetical protein